MATVSRFFGIVIRMFNKDHPPPHFHAEYGEFELIVNILPIVVREGTAPARVRSMVLEWAALHQEELLRNWDLCAQNALPLRIEPLE
jgi:hypothetical protein